MAGGSFPRVYVEASTCDAPCPDCGAPFPSMTGQCARCAEAAMRLKNVVTLHDLGLLPEGTGEGIGP